jgi:ABC-type Mn2+/Zn2+ transport system ATPase subunit
VEQDWDGLLSPHEQRLVAFARILITRPRFVVMANPFRDMSPDMRVKVTALFKQSDVTFILMGSPDGGGLDPRSDAFDAVLALESTGQWSWTPRVAA